MERTPFSSIGGDTASYGWNFNSQQGQAQTFPSDLDSNLHSTTSAPPLELKSNDMSLQAQLQSQPCAGAPGKAMLPHTFPASPVQPRQGFNKDLSDDDSAGEEFREQLNPSELVLLDLLGSGAQAVVYRAIWWRTFGSSTSAITVAVKWLQGGAGQRAHTCEQLTRKIRHPNLVKCYEATTTSPYLIVSEYCTGGSLYDRLCDKNASKLSWCQRLKILLDVASGMEYLHNSSPCILHRDLKSCNVLLTKPITSADQHPTAKVTDFGLSRVLMNSQAWMTRCVGTWRWMAPEVFSSNDYDERIDVFSFGILMFEVLTGEIPYSDTWPLNSAVNPRIGLHIINGHRPSKNLVMSGCPNKAVTLMQECWAGDPGDRPHFSAVRQQLQELLELSTLYSQVKNKGPF